MSRDCSTPPRDERANLLACYRSGQISERQWQEHLSDPGFRAWIEAQRVDPDRGVGR
ncbi:hypothetical protein [Sphingomonas sp. KC8]|uniref:hypothetical protein n=1 Tax=Sphingomonas sp. KC8 TaxID=1030157 RepID=UPI0002E2B3EA|nr:hypothetical protein [Sphingomonas sp. KC8]ARS27607.1 hypothetical protein KC8_09915 [Sphingomonas sp. KC8]